MTGDTDGTGYVATLIRMRREAAHLTQAELAEQAGVSRGTVVAAEARDVRSTIGFCLKVARALDIPIKAMIHAHVMDAMRNADPGLLNQVDAELRDGCSAPPDES